MLRVFTRMTEGIRFPLIASLTLLLGGLGAANLLLLREPWSHPISLGANLVVLVLSGLLLRLALRRGERLERPVPWVVVVVP